MKRDLSDQRLRALKAIPKRTIKAHQIGPRQNIANQGDLNLPCSATISKTASVKDLGLLNSQKKQLGQHSSRLILPQQSAQVVTTSKYRNTSSRSKQVRNSSNSRKIAKQSPSVQHFSAMEESASLRQLCKQISCDSDPPLVLDEHSMAAASHIQRIAVAQEYQTKGPKPFLIGD